MTALIYWCLFALWTEKNVQEVIVKTRTSKAHVALNLHGMAQVQVSFIRYSSSSPFEHVYTVWKLLNITRRLIRKVTERRRIRNQDETIHMKAQAQRDTKWLPQQRCVISPTTLQSNQSTFHFIKETLISSWTPALQTIMQTHAKVITVSWF